VADIPLEEIRPPWIVLRAVEKTSLEYMQLRDAIYNDGKNDGLLNSISVRTSVRWPGFYEVIDGMYRFTAYQELRIPTIPALILEKTDEEVLACQIQANSLRKETTPVEFARQLLRIKACIPGIKMSVMAKMVGKNPGWVKQQLSLLDLDEKTQRRVDRDEIPLRNAYMLAKIPAYIRESYTLLAPHTQVEEFQAMAEVVIRQVMESARNGKLIQNFVVPWKPQPYLKSLKVVLTEIKNRKHAVKAALNKEITTPLEGWVKALEWAASLDPESQEKQKAAVERRTAEQTIDREKYTAEIEEFES
jgi:ParB/RepB/Spo0J family partition protein